MYSVIKKVTFVNTSSNSQSAAFGSYCEASGGKHASLANPPTPLASLTKPRLYDRRGPLIKRLDLQVKPRPRMASEVGSEVTRSP